MDMTQTPQGSILGMNPDAIKLVLARLFGGTPAAQAGGVQAGPPTFPTTGGDTRAQGQRPPIGPGMTQPQPAAAAPSPGPRIGPGMTQPGPERPTPVGMEHLKAVAENKQRPGPVAGGLPAPTNAKQSQPPMTGDQSNAAPPPPLTEQEYGAQNPAAAHTPYQAPDLKHRMLEGLFAGMQGFRQPEIGAQTVARYLQGIEQNEQDEKNYPAQSAADAHQRYMNYLAGQKGPLDIENLRQTIAEREEGARRASQIGPSLDQQLANAVSNGDWDGAKKIADMNAAKTGRAPAGTAKQFTSPFQAYVYGDPAQKQAAQQFIELQKKMGARYERPSQFDEEWHAFKKDPAGYAAFKGSDAKQVQAGEKSIASLQKERDTVAHQYDQQLNDVRTDPANIAQIKRERDDRLKVYDRQIFNAQNGYKVGAVIDTPKGKQKITAIHPDGMLEVTPARRQ